VTVEQSRSGVIFSSASAPSSNNAILSIRSPLNERDPCDRDALLDHAAFANTSENKLERALSTGAVEAELC
jgi:hypothetical protein